MSAALYPEPPWKMHGRGVFVAVRVPVRELALPRGMSPVAVGGQAMGLLAFIDYQAPSPLTYRELIFMPCVVRAEAAGKKRVRGHWVARMYVDNEASLRGGRELWALPKTLASFSLRDGGVDVRAEDGTTLGLSFRARTPALPLRSSVLTLQREGDDLIRFRGDFRARVQLAQVRIDHFRSTDPGWRGFAPERRLPLPGAHFTSFESLMQPPRRSESKAA